MRMATSRVAQAWERFWFSPGSPIDLGVARVLVSVTSLWVLLSRDLPALSGVPQVFWSATPVAFRWRYLLFPGHESLERVLQWIAVAALVATCVGVWTRVSALIAGVLLIHLLPLEAFQWSASAFTMNIPVLGLFFAALSPSAEAVSIVRTTRPAPSWMFRWPVQAIRLQLCLLYFFSAYSKMLHAGPSWPAPAHMQAWVLGFYQRELPVYTTVAPWLANYPWLCGAMGIGALAVEVAFPLALFSRRARQVLLPLVLTMHIGIALALNISVLYWPVLLVFVDWDSVVQRWRRTRAR